MMLRHGKRFFLLALIPLVCFTGCEKRPGESELKASLGKVAEQYWMDRFIYGAYRSAYDLELKEGRPPFSEYRDKVAPRGQINYLGVKTKEVTIDQDKGVVLLTVKHEIPIPGVKKVDPLEGTIKDVWIYTSEGWRHQGKGESKN